MIEEFTGEHRFLSNFHHSPFVAHRQKWPTVEHAFQAMKTTLPEERWAILSCNTPGQAKRMGQKVQLRSGWSEMRVQIMFKLVLEKFRQNEKLSDMLFDTGHQELVEGNRWHDNFWGICFCHRCRCMDPSAKNHLGVVLMNVRKELQ